jgi:glycosyltransferase involved in cell wall biosynthesis
MNKLCKSAENPLVSILCPTYNAEKFIEKTLISILSQDYENIQIQISDDCSTDATVEIVERILMLHPGKAILNVNEVNQGITRNCNIALKMCHGKYIAFFAGDDLMYPGKIKAQVEAMERNPDCSFSYHSVDVLDGENNNRLLFTSEVGVQNYFSFLDIISRGGLIGACSVMARADAIPPYGFYDQFPSVSDWLMQIEIALRGQILKVDGVYGGYLRHSKGASRKTFETLGEIEGTMKFIQKRYGNAPEILSATNKGYNRYLLGEIARIFIAGDKFKLRRLQDDYLIGKLGLQFLSIILLLLLFFNVHRFWMIKKLFLFLSSHTKK